MKINRRCIQNLVTLFLLSLKYIFSNCEETTTSQDAKDESLARWLWAVSMKWTKLENIKQYQI